MKKNLLLSALALFFLCSNFLQAASINGTISTINNWIESPQTFADTETVTGLVSLRAGFKAPAAGTVTFNTIGEVGGEIDLNTGTLALDGDLILTSTATLAASSGTIDGKGNAIFMNGNLTIPAVTISFSSDTTIDGQGKTLNLASGAAFSIASNQTLTLRNMNLILNSANQIVLAAGASLILENVNFCFKANQLFVDGSITFNGQVNLIGPGQTFIHKTVEAFTIGSCSTLLVDIDTTFEYSLDTDRTKLILTDQTSRLHLNGCTFHAAVNGFAIGVQLTKGTVLFENKVTLDNDGNTIDAFGIEFGDGISAANDVDIKVLSGAQVIVDGYFFYNPA